MPDAVSRLVPLVRDRIAELADPVRAPQMQAYMKSELPYRGVPSAPLRAVLRRVLAEHPLPDRAAWESAVRLLWDDAFYREERYAATTLAGHRLYRAHQDPDTLVLHRHLITTGAWWDHVDALATRHVGPVLATYPTEVEPVMRAWSVEDDLWLRRTAILCQLHHRERTDLDLLRDVVVANLEGTRHGSEFFVRKAIGWALRQHARTDPGWVRAFVEEHHDRLAGLSRREALKHL